MTTTERRATSQLMDAAIAHVIATERAEGRTARDIRDQPGAVADVASGDRLIAVKACGTTSRDSEVLLECRHYVAARDDPDRFWLYLVENIDQGDPAWFHLIRIGGSRLEELLERAKEQRYWSVPLPGRLYDAAVADDRG